MFWLDAYEEAFKGKGVVYLFGKVKVKEALVSCSVAVNGISRRVFLLPRAQRVDADTQEVVEGSAVTMKDVYDEFNNKVCKKYGIKQFKCKEVKKSLANKAEGETEILCLEVRYSFGHDALPAALSGETFSAALGQSSPALEL